MARFLLNSAVVTAPGRYDYRYLTPDEARAWYAAGPVVSTIGYPETAAALGELLGATATVAVDRRIITMQSGDEALVFRLALPPGSPRIDPADKGRLGREVLADHFELGALRRLPDRDEPEPLERMLQAALAGVGPVRLLAVLRALASSPEEEAMDRQEAEFAARLARLLAERGMTREELATSIDVGLKAIEMLLSRRSRPQRRTLEKIALALGVAVSDLWPGPIGPVGAEGGAL